LLVDNLNWNSCIQKPLSENARNAILQI
jgi:hypothetical protein